MLQSIAALFWRVLDIPDTTLPSNVGLLEVGAIIPSKLCCLFYKTGSLSLRGSWASPSKSQSLLVFNMLRLT